MPDWKQIVREHLAALRLPPEREIEIAEELAQHLEAVYDEAISAGVSEQEALARALKQIADWQLLECELSRIERPIMSHWLPPENLERRGGIRMESLWQDLRYGWRALRTQPGFALIAIITLTLGIGANTAIFSLVNAVLLRPAPYLDNTRLVAIESGNELRDVKDFGGASPADFWDWREQSQAFEQLAAMVGDGGIAVRGERPELLRGPRVSTNYFDLLNARPLLGRTFRAEDGMVAAADTVVLSYRAWQRKFGGDPNILGRMLDDNGVQVIGVMPPDFRYPDYAESWIPLSRDSGEMRTRRTRYYGVYGLLKPGQTVASAQAELKAVAVRLAAQYPDSNKNITIALTPLRDRMVRDVKPSLLIMLAAVGFVLLIACANVANLLLARAATRRKELAIRAALGATRGRLIAQLLVESLLLALTGGAMGLLLAAWGKGLLVGLLPESYAYLQLQDAVRVDGAVLLFTLTAAVATGLLFGLLPAWRASRVPVNECLKDGRGNQDGMAGRRTRGALVVAELGLALVLLVGAGLLIGSFLRLQRVDPGFDPQNLFVSSIDVSPGQYRDEASRVARIQRLQERVASVPGVADVAVTTGVSFPYLQFNVNRVNDPLPVAERALYDAVSANYFRVMRVPLLEGREFNEFDRAGTEPIVIINETLARQSFAGGDPIGQLLTYNYLGGKQQRQIVGIVKDHAQGDPARIQPQIYIPYTQQTWFSHTLLVRSTLDPASTRAAVESAIGQLDAKYIPGKIDAPAETLGKALAEPKLYTWLLGAFAAVALLLAAVGIYGVMAYSVAQRTHEIGIRVALGAQAGDVLRLVLGQGMKLVSLGLALGLGAALALTRLMKTLLFGVSATDPLTFALLAVVLAAVALLACYLPARRATRVDPLVALRTE
ncbi:MAG: ADOP family duplicated permease [Blastocatellia bacterium]